MTGWELARPRRRAALRTSCASSARRRSVTVLVTLAGVAAFCPRGVAGRQEVRTRQAATEWARLVAFVNEPREPEFAEVFDLTLTIRVAPGLIAFLPDTLLPASASVSAGAGRWEATSGPADSLDVRATYPVMAFLPGGVELPEIELLTRPAAPDEAPGTHSQSELGPDDRQGLDRSVLYSGGVLVMTPSGFVGDNEGLMPRPPADVIGGERSVWWIAALAALGAGGLILAWWVVTLVGRGEGGGAEAPTSGPPRDEALRELDRILAEGWHANGRVAQFYEATTDVLRRFSEIEEPEWRSALTSSELLGQLESRWGSEPVRALRSAVWTAECAKFGRARPKADEAEQDWTTVRDWIASREDG